MECLDSNPGPQDGRRRRNHGAMAATCIAIFAFHKITKIEVNGGTYLSTAARPPGLLNKSTLIDKWALALMPLSQIGMPTHLLTQSPEFFIKAFPSLLCHLRQVKERFLRTPAYPGSNPVIVNFYWTSIYWSKRSNMVAFYFDNSNSNPSEV